MEERRLQETKKCSYDRFDMISLPDIILEIFMTF